MTLVMYVKWPYDTLGRPLKPEWKPEHKKKLKMHTLDMDEDVQYLKKKAKEKYSRMIFWVASFLDKIIRIKL